MSVAIAGEIIIVPEKNYVPTFHFDKSKPCHCNSGLEFGACCSMSNPDRAVPGGIHIVKAYLSPAECKQIIRYADKQKRTWLTINDADKSTDSKLRVKRDPSRVTQEVDLGKKRAQVNEWLRDGCTKHIETAITCRPQWFERAQLLRYGPGGKYHLHSDSEELDPLVNQYFRVIDRDFSMLIYLNSNYEGGGLRFPQLDYVYQPEAGDFVFFPSHHVFSHESLPITSGTKYALVSWGTLVGSKRLLPHQSLYVVPV